MKYILPMQNAKVNSLTNRTNKVLRKCVLYIQCNGKMSEFQVFKLHFICILEPLPYKIHLFEQVIKSYYLLFYCKSPFENN